MIFSITAKSFPLHFPIPARFNGASTGRVKHHCLVFAVMSLGMLGFMSAAQAVFINELHYDNTGADQLEGVELAGIAGQDLTDWTLAFYTGSNGTSYDSIALSGVIPDLEAGYGVLSFALSSIQNGPNDGLALVDDTDTLIQFLSYEGSFVATNGLANGEVSLDIGVAESSSTPLDYSLQLLGTGNSYADFSWTQATPASFGLVNSGQTFEGPVLTDSSTQVPEPSPVILLLLGLAAMAWMRRPAGLQSRRNVYSGKPMIA